MRVIVAAGAATISAFAACFIKPDPPMIGSGDGDGGVGDAGGDGHGDGALQTCLGGPSDDMGSGSSSMACGTWGMPNVASGTLMRTGGVLQAMVFGPTGYAECTTMADFDFANGASIEIPTVLPGSGDMTRFSVFFDGGVDDVTIRIQNQWVSATCSGPGGGGSAMYSPGTRYFKIARSGAANLNAYYSANGSGGWSSFMGCTLSTTNLTVASARIGAIGGGSGSSMRSATFDNLRTCTTPP
jgi:hypothetical protein